MWERLKLITNRANRHHTPVYDFYHQQFQSLSSPPLFPTPHISFPLLSLSLSPHPSPLIRSSLSPFFYLGAACSEQGYS